MRPSTSDTIRRDQARLVQLIRLAISAPGTYTPRGIDNPQAHPDDQEPENLRSWGARAVMCALATNGYLMTAAARVAASPECGAGLIAAERQRQLEAGGYGADHDDRHNWRGELLDAARCYALLGRTWFRPHHHAPHPDLLPQDHGWPWWSDGQTGPPQVIGWSPSHDPIRNLVKAGALIAAEIDRLQRRLGAPSAGGAK